MEKLQFYCLPSHSSQSWPKLLRGPDPWEIFLKPWEIEGYPGGRVKGREVVLGEGDGGPSFRDGTFWVQYQLLFGPKDPGQNDFCL